MEEKRNREVEALTEKNGERYDDSDRMFRELYGAGSDKAQRKRERRALAEERKADREMEKEERRMQSARRKQARRKKRRRVWRTIRIVITVLFLLALAALAGLGYWGYTVTESEEIFPNIYANGIFLGGQTYEQAVQTLDEAGWDDALKTTLTVRLPMNITMVLNRAEACSITSKEAAARAAREFGHTGTLWDWYANLRLYLENRVEPYDVCQVRETTLDKVYIEEKITAAEQEFQRLTGDGSYTINDEKTVMTMMKGGGELRLDEVGLAATIERALLNGDTELTFTALTGTVRAPDFESIYRELAVEPVNAWYNTETKEIEPSRDGFSFDPEEAKNIWYAADFTEVIKIPVQVLEPDETTESLSAKLFVDMLGAKETYYASSSSARINNISLAASKINGVVLNPGETFSYNETVGQRTAEAGFQEAAAYSNGEVVQEIGGGICQVSSTLYCATLYANLETVSRTPHYFAVDYIDKGQDATVSWKSPDFKFKNNHEYPIRIVAYTNVDERALRIEIWGTDVDHTYVELDRYTYTIYDSTYTDVAIGTGVQEYRTVYDQDGNYVETIYEIYDIYHYHDYDIDWPQAYYNAKNAAASANSAPANTAPTNTGTVYSGVSTGGASVSYDYGYDPGYYDPGYYYYDTSGGAEISY